MYYLGVDLGGTNIASAVVTEKGELLGRSSIPTGLPDSPEHIAVLRKASWNTAAIWISTIRRFPRWWRI